MRLVQIIYLSLSVCLSGTCHLLFVLLQSLKILTMSSGCLPNSLEWFKIDFLVFTKAQLRVETQNTTVLSVTK